MHIILFLAAIFFPILTMANPMPSVIVDLVLETSFDEKTTFIGHVVAEEQSMLSTDISGVVKNVFIKEGDIVEKDQPLIKLNDERLQIEKRSVQSLVQSAKARLVAADALLEGAQLKLARETALKGTPAFSKAHFEDLTQEFNESYANQQALKAELEQDLAQLALNEYNLKKTILYAPFSGTVIKKMVAPGTYVSPNTEVLQLLNHLELEIEIQVPYQQQQFLSPGYPANILLNQITYQANVRASILAKNQASQTLPVRLTPSPKLEKKLIYQQSVIVEISQPTNKTALSVHKDALLSQPQGIVVFIVEDNKAIMKSVEIGQAIGNRMEVKSGLNLNDKAIIRGNERLRPSQPVKAIMNKSNKP